jgi:TRAP-type mannitol/chloroaromatic compound transport system permease small subunit
LRILAGIAAVIDWINEMIGRAVSWFTVFVVLNVFVVVVMRYVFGIGHVWMQELYVWVHAAVFMIGSGYTLLHDGHVRIDVIYREASQKYKATVNLLGALFLGLPFMWILFFKALPLARRSFERGEMSSEVGGLPALYLLKGTILVFAILMGLQLVSMILKSLLTLVGAEKKREEVS